MRRFLSRTPLLMRGLSSKASEPVPSLTQLGKTVGMAKSPMDATLERVLNPHADSRYLSRFSCPEFTSLCPVTGEEGTWQWWKKCMCRSVVGLRGIHVSLWTCMDYVWCRSTRLCSSCNRLRSSGLACGVKILETVPPFLQESRRLS